MGRTFAFTFVTAFAFVLLAIIAGRHQRQVLGAVLAATACTFLAFGLLIWLWE